MTNDNTYTEGPKTKASGEGFDKKGAFPTTCYSRAEFARLKNESSQLACTIVVRLGFEHGFNSVR